MVLLGCRKCCLWFWVDPGIFPDSKPNGQALWWSTHRSPVWADNTGFVLYVDACSMGVREDNKEAGVEWWWMHTSWDHCYTRLRLNQCAVVSSQGAVRSVNLLANILHHTRGEAMRMQLVSAESVTKRDMTLCRIKAEQNTDHCCDRVEYLMQDWVCNAVDKWYVRMQKAYHLTNCYS